MDKIQLSPTPEKRPARRSPLWQLAVCLLLFLAALFLRAFTDVRADFLGTASLRELAASAGQALAHSELIRVFAGSFQETYEDVTAPAAAGEVR